VTAPRWYASGLRFACRRCGACCTGAPGYVWLRGEEAAALAARLGLGLAEFLASHTRQSLGAVSLREEADGRCVLFEPGHGCRAYDARPRQCRTWPFWPGIVATPEAWEREAAGCPGMGAGELIAAEEIERRARPPQSAQPRSDG
jgi:Fe-S-cluster containining protein